MVTRVKTGVAPLGPVDVSSLTDLLSQQLGFAQAAEVPDPRTAIQESIGAIPRVPPAENIPVSREALLSSDRQIGSVEEAAQIAGSEFRPAAQEQPETDAGGNVIVDPLTGERKMKPITVGDYNEQFQSEKSAFANVVGPTSAISKAPYQAEGAVRELLENQYSAAFLSNARKQDKLDAHYADLNEYVGKVGPVLGNVVKTAEETLFTNRTKAAAMADDNKSVVPAGILVMAGMGDANPDTARMISTMGGVAFTQSVAQMGVVNPNREKAGENLGATAPQGTQYLSDAINSVSHFFKNGVRNTGIQLSSGDVEFMSKALVMAAIRRGDLSVATDPSTSREVIVASPSLKQQAMNMQRIADAMVGTTTRAGSATTPFPSGTSFTRGRPQVSARSLMRGDFVTTAANATKNILGSVAFTFRKKDYDRKVQELALVFGEGFVKSDLNTGEFEYSTHPLAKRNGVDSNAFEAAKVNVAVPEGFDKDNPSHVAFFKQKQEEEARKVMATKRADIEFTMKSIADKSGLRYGEFIHSLANQRFFVNSYDLDYMGSKNIIRDVLGLAYQDTIRVDHMFDPRPIEILKRKADWVFSGKGQEIHENLTKLNPSELGAIGFMHNAVMYYYTALDNSVHNVTKMPVADAIQLYTPAIAERLAGLGEKYNAFLANPTVEPDNEMMGLWVAAEKGEALGTLNLWDDAFKAKSLYGEEASKRHSIPMSHHVFDDGNQNGIFLQALFFGMNSKSDSSDSLVRLGTANPNLDDMRVHGFTTMVNNLDQLLHDDEAKREAWRSFWSEAQNLHPEGKDGVAKDFFKKPLMQHAYGKDAAMFTNVMYELLASDRMYIDLATKHLVPAFGSTAAASTSLSSGVEVTLRQLIDSHSTYVMKSIGRDFALLNTPMTLEGVTGDTYVVSPVGLAPLNKNTKNKNFTKIKINGQDVYLKKPEYVGHTLVNPETGEKKEIPSYGLQMLPTDTVGKQRFLNRETMKYDEFNNPIGMSLSRQAPVLLIQALDGDLVKWSTIEANKGLKTPRPVMWVHDSIISTPGQSLIYTNMYNNVALPRAIKEIKKLGGKIKDSLDRARKATLESVAAKGEPVGIGANGEYPAIGALFNEYANRIDPDDETYKDIYIKRKENEVKQQRASKKAGKVQSEFNDFVKGVEKKSPLQKWEQWRNRVASILDEAEKLGWVDPKVLDDVNQKYVAVDHTKFPRLLELAEQLINVSGPTNTVDAWVKNFPNRVANAEEVLMSSVGYGGIRQMSSSGGKRKKAISESVLPKATVTRPDNINLLVKDTEVPRKGGIEDEIMGDGGFDVPYPG